VEQPVTQPLEGGEYPLMEAFKDLLMRAGAMRRSLIDALAAKCREQLIYLTNKPDLDSVEKDHLSAISCVYCHLLTSLEDEMTLHLTILPNVIQKIVQDNFTENCSAFLVEGYVMLCEKSFDLCLFEMIISVLYSGSKSSFSLSDKMKVNKVFHDHVIPFYLSLS
jgi:hypothetical protein